MKDDSMVSKKFNLTLDLLAMGTDARARIRGTKRRPSVHWLGCK
ncbi:hypothetical protein [Variovorax guangxiensis]|nr:hypothetical protein [Variovorax guangxiensis]MDR6858483.1 hypothetical protein [Variovorax guangxiensis]